MRHIKNACKYAIFCEIKHFGDDLDRNGVSDVTRRKKHGDNDNGTKDLHHILYQRRCWRGGAIGELREFWYCKVYIPRSTLHRTIHMNVSGVPLPSQANAKAALQQLRLLEEYGAIHDADSLSKRLMVLIALFDYVEPKTAKGLTRQLDIARHYDKPS